MPRDEAPLDLTIADTLRRVRARDDAPAPDPAFVARLEESLMNHGAFVEPHRLTITRPAAPGADGRWHEHVPHPKTPYRPRLAVAALALVLLAVASAVVATRQAPPTDPRGESARLAAFQLATPSPGARLCTIPPRTTGPSGGATTYDMLLPAGDEFGVRVLTLEDQIPRGDPAPPDVVAGITATLLAHDACDREYPGEWTEVGSEEATSRILALYTDDYLRRAPTVDPPETASTPNAYPPDWHPGVISYHGIELQQAWLLPDGRVSAVVGNPWQNPSVLVFVRADDWWLIDEVAVLITEDSGTPVVRLPLAAEIVAVLDEGFSPSQAVILPDQDVVVTLINLEPALEMNFTIDALGISVDLQPGERKDVIINAPAGVYAFYSDIPGQAALGFIGTLLVADVEFEPPHREAPRS